LPATGPTDTGTTAAIAAGLVLTGGALVGLRRRAVKP
jgi:LPXTG-motif cell wall-anchored protein